MDIKETIKKIAISGAYWALHWEENHNRNEWFIINVAMPEENRKADVFVPITLLWTATEAPTVPVARLEVAASAIEYGLGQGKSVLIHCSAGIERSPLCVVWYLHTRFNVSLDVAYSYVMEIRDIALDRRSWIKYDGYNDFLKHST